MDEVKKVATLKGMNPLLKKTLDNQIKQLKELEKILGRKNVQHQIDSAPLPQEGKDYVYIHMGWL